ncbi:MAG: hypothetical protein ACLR8P_14675 [Clostridium fessum]
MKSLQARYLDRLAELFTDDDCSGIDGDHQSGIDLKFCRKERNIS